jgi:hypothetical protein
LRPSSAITVTLALLLSFIQAPFAHTHRRDPDHLHAVGLSHSHFGLLSGRNLALHVPDDDDVAPIDWVVLTKEFSQPFVAITNEPSFVPSLGPQQQVVRTPTARAHDPPLLHAVPSRAPPA